MSSSAASVAVRQPSGRPRERWLADAIIAGFIAVGASTVALIVAYGLAVASASSDSDIFRLWLWQLTHNEIVSFSRATPAIAIGVHVVLGLLWAVVYAAFVEPRLGGPGWWRGARFALLPWLISLFALLPAAAVGLLGMALSAGPLPPVGNLILHMVYGVVLGALFDVNADRPDTAQGNTDVGAPIQHITVAQTESLGAAGIVGGGIVGALVGIGMAVVLPPILPEVDFGGWSVALAVGGMLAGGAVGGIVGSFAGLPTTHEHDAEHGSPDTVDQMLMPFLIPVVLALVIGAMITAIGTGLLQLDKTQAVIAACVLTGAVGIAAAILASRQPSPSSRETVSHSSEH